MHKALRAGAFALLFALLAPSTTAMADVPSSLKEAAAGGAVPADLAVIYDDMHAFHGGTTIELAGDGKATRRDLDRGQESTTAATLSAAQLKALLELLVQQAAWEQRTESRLMVPGESKATLTVRAGGEEVSFWEFFNDMEDNKRLIVIKKAMVELVPAAAGEPQ